MGKDVISKIVFVCSDMWEPYLKLIRENCSEALHIPRPLPYRRQYEQSTRQRPCRGNQPHET